MCLDGRCDRTICGALLFGCTSRMVLGHRGFCCGGDILYASVSRLLPVWMSMAGAGCITWAMHQPRNVEWFVGLTILGTLIQVFFGATVTDLDDP